MAARSAAGPRWPIPNFKLEDAFARFRKGYTPAHFADPNGTARSAARAGAR